MNAMSNDTQKRLLTIKQQINNLKVWNKTQENKLILQRKHKPKNQDECCTINPSKLRSIENIGYFNAVEEQPLIPRHANFHELLDAKLKDNEPNDEGNTKKVPKKKFLKKGEGLSRFKMKPKCMKHTQGGAGTSPRRPLHEEHSSKSDALKAFEILEEQANDLSFCSTSSMVEQLMEDSIKSTPIKSDDFQDEKYQKVINACVDNYEFFGSRKLGVIDEEPSKLDCTAKEEFGIQSANPSCNVVIVDKDYETEPSASECSSMCSCQNSSRYMSTSVSMFAEETTVYSPLKGKEDWSGGYEQGVEDDGQLRSLLQTRLKELEIEIDAFRSENAHLSKLRSEYETEYNKFCEEKTQFLQKIREEHLKDLKELELGRKKLEREKFDFEKHMKETRNKPSKHEKEEIRLLKEEIKVLKDEMNKKESRWAAAQARIRTEMKQLKDRNVSLKNEVEKLQKTPKTVTFAPTLKKSKSSSNIIFKIDKEIERTKSNVEKVKPPPITRSPDVSFLDSYEFNNINFNNLKSYDIDAFKSAPENTEISDEELQPELGYRNSNEETSTLNVSSGNGREKFYEDGRKEIWYPNGNVKKISPDGKIVKIIYYNGDVEEQLKDAKMVKYYYAESKIWHSEYSNGLEIIEFPNGHIEKRHKDGSKEVAYPNGNIYCVDSQGEQKWTNVDGTVIISNKENNEKKIYFPNGQIEVHTLDFKKREYPDGTTKTIYNDGIQETRYANGRIRLKTKEGRLLSDSEIT